MALIRLNAIDANASNAYLKQLTGKDVGTPPPLTNLNKLGQLAQGNYTYVSVGVASSLGFGLGDINASTDQKVMTTDYVATANEQDPSDNGIDSWTYGAGYRLGVLTSDTEAKARIGLAGLAATATLTNKKVEIQVQAFGLPGGPPIPFADITKFDVEAFGILVKWQRDVIEYVTANRQLLDPVRIYASLSIDMDQFINDADPMLYSLRRIQDKSTLADAIKTAVNKNIPHVVGHDELVRAVYAHVTGYGAYLNPNPVTDNQPISDDSKRKAEAILQRFDTV